MNKPAKQDSITINGTEYVPATAISQQAAQLDGLPKWKK